MIARFFVILQRNWTYEVEYTLEIWRMVFIHVVTIGIPAIVLRTLENPPALFCVILVVSAYVCWRCYFRCSVARILQIKTNRKYAVAITKEQLARIAAAYPKQDFYCKLNGAYRRVRSPDEVGDGDSIILITIGKKQLIELRKYRRIIENEDGEES